MHLGMRKKKNHFCQIPKTDLLAWYCKNHLRFRRRLMVNGSLTWESNWRYTTRKINFWSKKFFITNKWKIGISERFVGFHVAKSGSICIKKFLYNFLIFVDLYTKKKVYLYFIANLWIYSTFHIYQNWLMFIELVLQ